MFVRMSVLGLFNYDETIFDNLTLPDGLDKTNLINYIIRECSELTCVIPNATILKAQIGYWSARKLPIWQKLYNTTQLEYDPIENYNRYEESSDERTVNSTSNSQSTSESKNLTENGDSTGSYATAYNSDTLKQTAESRNVYDDQTTDSGTDTATGTDNNTHTAHLHGNIGTTSSQDMIKWERQVDTFDIYTVIVDDFIDYFCVRVY